jgi:hypothetical protein
MAALVIALGISISVVTAVLSAALNPHRVLTTEEGTVLAGVVGAMIGSLATYLGAIKGDDKE